MEIEQTHTEEVQDIIGKPPHGLVRWGITWVFLVILAIIALSAFIYYPDIVKVPIRIHTTNSPKPVVSKLSGSMVKLLIPDNSGVQAGQVIGWLESTGDHRQIQELYDSLISFRQQFQQADSQHPTFPEAFTDPTRLKLGEIQNAYQSFYIQFLTYKSTQERGIFHKRKEYLHQEIDNIRRQREHLEGQKSLQEQDFILAESEMNRYKVLAEKKVISASEFEKQQSGFLSRQHPLQQTQSALITNEGTMQARQKDLADLEHQVQEEGSKFLQALNSLISQIEEWKRQYLLTAPLDGTLMYSGIVEENQFIDAGKELFFITPESSGFFGEIQVPQYNLGKVKNGQKVLVKLDSYPFEEFGIIEGKINHFSYVPVQDSIFLARVEFDQNLVDPRIHLRPGLSGAGEIVTEDASLLSRLYRNIIKIIK